MPPTWDPLNDDPETGDSIPVAFLELEGRTVEHRKGFACSTAPASPEEGQVWVDTSALPHRVYRYLRIDGGNPSWQPVGPLSRLPVPLNGDPSLVDDRQAPHEYLALGPPDGTSFDPMAGPLRRLARRMLGWVISDEPSLSFWRSVGVAPTTASGVAVTDQTALRVTAELSCVKVLAELISTLPLIVRGACRERHWRKSVEKQLGRSPKVTPEGNGHRGNGNGRPPVTGQASAPSSTRSPPATA